MKIAFVSANREQLPDPVVPLGILYLMAATSDEHDKVLWDLCFEDEPLRLLRERLEAFAPDMVAIGLRNIQNSDYTGYRNNLASFGRLLRTLREHTEAAIVLGGGAFSVMPKEIMEALKPDYGIAGEGEIAFPALVAALVSCGGHRAAPAKRRPALSHIGNLHYFDDGRLISNPPSGRFLDLARLRAPSRAHVDRRYYTEAGIESVQTKRGCALSCDYCTYPTIEGRTVRTREPDAVVDEMLALADANREIDHFFIVDSVFNIPSSHAKAVCRAMIRQGFCVPWTCYANPLGFDLELAELMRTAGCVGLEIGADSGCDEILERLRKGFDSKKIREIHRICTDVGLLDCHTFMLGTPGETMDHAMRTLELIIEVDPFAAVIMAYLDDYEVLDSSYARERLALREKVLELLDRHRKSHPRWVIPTLGVNFRLRLFRYLRAKGLRGPLWQHLGGAEKRAIDVDDGDDGDQAAVLGGADAPHETV